MLSDPKLRLRAAPVVTPFHVVLVEPEIPPNTGNIARLCAATRTPLHLVGRLGFSIDEHAVRRAGLDYWHLVSLQTHADWQRAREHLQMESKRIWLFTGKSSRSLYDVHFTPGDALVFGKESVGLPDALTQQMPEQCVAIPTLGGVRSLNLANSVAISLYEVLRQVGAFQQVLLEPLPAGQH